MPIARQFRFNLVNEADEYREKLDQLLHPGPHAKWLASDGSMGYVGHWRSVHSHINWSILCFVRCIPLLFASQIIVQGFFYMLLITCTTYQ